jgi:hypothetical protein
LFEDLNHKGSLRNWQILEVNKECSELPDPVRDEEDSIIRSNKGTLLLQATLLVRASHSSTPSSLVHGRPNSHILKCCAHYFHDASVWAWLNSAMRGTTFGGFEGL